MNLSDLYSEVFANWISGGNLIAKEKISLLGIKPLYDRFVTNRQITKVWCILSIPVNYSTNITQAIRTEMFKMCPEVRTIISTVNTPVQINPKSDVFTRQLKRSANMYNQYKEIFDNLSEDEQLTGTVEYDNHGRRSFINADILKVIKDLYDSYTYVFDRSTHNMEFMESYFFIQASAKSKSALRKFKKCFLNFMTGEGIVVSELRGNINQYLNNFCPATYQRDSVRKIQPMLLSEENFTSIMNYKNKGLIGERGVLIAQDRQVNLPFYQDFFHSGAAQVNAILAESGWGKTNLAFWIALSLMGYNETHCSAIDIKGDEWSKLLNFVDGQIIDMDKGMFFNTMRLDDLHATKDDCEEFYNLAIRDTVQLYERIINLQPSEGNEKDFNDILNAGVSKIFYQKGVVATNPDTFKFTKDLKFSDIIDIFETLVNSASYTDAQKNICAIAKTRCAAFFLSETGKGAEMSKAITMQSLLDAPLTIYSFNKNNNAELDLLDSLRVFMVQTADNRVAMIRKRKGLFTAAFYEELQRCVNSKDLIRYISSRVTGSRSDNVIIFLLLNAISAFEDDALAQIRSNITSFYVGKVNEHDANKLINDYDCRMIGDYIKAINSGVTEYYRNCFAVKYDTGYSIDKCIIKLSLPEEIQNVFKTRKILDD